MPTKTQKILIADDSAFMRKILRDIFESEGYTNILEVENGRQACDKFNDEKPDLVLMDIVMPEMDGIEALKQIGKTAKVIMITAVGQDKTIEEAKANGAVGYILKPFDKTKVLQEAGKILK